MATLIELEFERVLTDDLLGDNTVIQDKLNARALAGWTLEAVLNIAAGIESLLFFERLTLGPPP